MSKLLFEVENYRGSGMAASLFFDAKVTEAISLVVDAWKKQSQKRERPLSAEDAEGLQNVTSYIADHYAFDIPLERLANRDNSPLQREVWTWPESLLPDLRSETQRAD